MDLNTKWSITLYGWILYNAFVFFIEKQKYDRKNEDFHYKIFAWRHIDDWLITLIFCPLIVVYGPDIHALLNLILNLVSPLEINIPWYDIFYAGCGPLVALLYFFATKLWPSLKIRIVKKVKGDGEAH